MSNTKKIIDINGLERFSNNFKTYISDTLVEYNVGAVDTDSSVDDVETNANVALMKISYSDLKDLRDNKKLIPGIKYRIIDYTTTTSWSGTRSEHHDFDIIVEALSNDTLSEDAKACLRDGDTYFTQRESNLSAWELKYCLDNDNTRFVWADTDNGKGVIYYLKDEYNNECPYDFKNITYKNINNNQYDYTFSYDIISIGSTTINESGKMYDGTTNSAAKYCCYNNVLKKYVPYHSSQNRQYLNNIIFRNSEAGVDKCYSNKFDYSCGSMSFGNNCTDNTFGYNCHDIIIGSDCKYNTFGDNCYCIDLDPSNCYNTFGNNCINIKFFQYCGTNVVGDNCVNINIGNKSQCNTINNCQYIYLGTKCNNNSFNNNRDITVGLGTLLENLSNFKFNECENLYIKHSPNFNYNDAISNVTFANIRGLDADNKYHILLSDKIYKNKKGYETRISMNSNGEIVQYCEEDVASSSTKVEWNNDSNMNDYRTEGTYDIYGERTNVNDNLPILNSNPGHSIAARLNVIDSSLRKSDGSNPTEIHLTQFLMLDNRVGPSADMFMRTYTQDNGKANDGSGTWSNWKKFQGIEETYINTDENTLNNVGVYIGSGLNSMVDNGIYTGIYTDDFTMTSPSFIETFTLITINNYAVANSDDRLSQTISQLKYAVDAITNQATVKKRIKFSSNNWTDWEDVGGNSGAAEVDITEILKTYDLKTLVNQGFAKEGVTYTAKFERWKSDELKFDSGNKISSHIDANFGDMDDYVSCYIKVFNGNIIIDAYSSCGKYCKYTIGSNYGIYVTSLTTNDNHL